MIALRTKIATLIVFGVAATNASYSADDDVYAFVQADRLEYVERSDSALWELQGWVGDDYHKLWWKAEGEHENGSAEENELQLLYSHAYSAFFDWQIGVRHDFDPSPSRSQLVIGVQGLAPQWFEVDAAAFISEDGDLSARVEIEYDLLLTQRLVLQPRFEVELNADDLPEIGIGSGVSSTELGVRLRYEYHRKFAPYFGVSWNKLYGRTADFAALDGGDDEDTSFVAGVRLWF